MARSVLIAACASGAVAQQSEVQRKRSHDSVVAELGEDDSADPYVRACRAECMLAVLMLHLEQVDVNFIDSDRLEVLRGVGASSSLQAVRTALEV